LHLVGCFIWNVWWCTDLQTWNFACCLVPVWSYVSHSLLEVGCWEKNFSLKGRKKQKAEKCIQCIPFNMIRGFPSYLGYICCHSAGDTLKILRKTTVTWRYNVYWHKYIIHKKLLTYTSVYLLFCKEICVREVNVSAS